MKSLNKDTEQQIMESEICENVDVCELCGEIIQESDYDEVRVIESPKDSGGYIMKCHTWCKEELENEN